MKRYLTSLLRVEEGKWPQEETEVSQIGLQALLSGLTASSSGSMMALKRTAGRVSRASSTSGGELGGKMFAQSSWERTRQKNVHLITT